MPFDGATILLTGDRTRRAASELVQRAPPGWVVTIDKPKRSLAQSSKFWATCSEVAKSGVPWGGIEQNKQSWHDLFVSGWLIAAKHEPPRMLIGLEGERVSLVRHTRWMSEADMSDLLDYTSAWCAMRSISLRE